MSEHFISVLFSSTAEVQKGTKQWKKDKMCWSVQNVLICTTCVDLYTNKYQSFTSPAVTPRVREVQTNLKDLLCNFFPFSRIWAPRCYLSLRFNMNIQNSLRVHLIGHHSEVPRQGRPAPSLETCDKKDYYHNSHWVASQTSDKLISEYNELASSQSNNLREKNWMTKMTALGLQGSSSPGQTLQL